MNELEQIKKQIKELETFRQGMERQQLIYPLDTQTLKTINEDIVIQEGPLVTYDSVSYSEPFEVTINNKVYNIESTPEF